MLFETNELTFGACSGADSCRGFKEPNTLAEGDSRADRPTPISSDRGDPRGRLGIRHDHRRGNRAGNTRGGTLLLVSFAAVLGAYVPGVVFNAYGGSLRSLIQVAIPTFLAAIETTLGLLLLVRGFLPIAAADRGSRWPWWTALGFIAIALVHFFVE